MDPLNVPYSTLLHVGFEAPDFTQVSLQPSCADLTGSTPHVDVLLIVTALCQ